MKACIACKHMEKSGNAYLCKHPNAGRSVVNGAVSDVEVYCADVRFPPEQLRRLGICGIEGRLWEAKE